MELKGVTVEVLQKGPKKLDKISKLMSKFQVNQEISSNFVAFLKKSELSIDVL